MFLIIEGKGKAEKKTALEEEKGRGEGLCYVFEIGRAHV